MDYDNLIRESEQKFEDLKMRRESLIKDAEEVLTEMTKLQGEWRLLNKLKEEPKEVKANKKANVIEAVPEEVTK